VRSGQSGSYVSKLEAGTIEPSLRGFARLAKALEMTPQEIYTVVLCEAAGEKEEEDE
jgi:transcriptional regulator with XRE-family HTH domain